MGSAKGASFKAHHWADCEEWVEDIGRYRHKQPAEIDSIGRGRVWSGEHGEEAKLLRYPRNEGMLEALRRGGLAAALRQRHVGPRLESDHLSRTIRPLLENAREDRRTK
jgi:hypothetical protein